MKTAKRDYNFSPKLEENLKDLIKRVQMNKASLILIDGPIGEGKTTLGVLVADYINKLYNFPEIDFNEQLALGGEDFQAKLRVCFSKKYPCLIYDEAGDFNRRGALTRFNMLINRTFETFRAFKIIPILCLPLFSVLDSDLFNKGIPRVLLHLTGRTTKIGRFSGYSAYRMYYLRNKIDKIIVKPQAFSYTDPNFYGNFWNLEPKRAKELDLFSTKGKLEILQKSETEGSGLLNSKNLAQKLGISRENLSQITKKCKISPEKVINRRHYYNQNQIDFLINFIEKR